jgi:hypothetical protein
VREPDPPKEAKPRPAAAPKKASVSKTEKATEKAAEHRIA